MDCLKSKCYRDRLQRMLAGVELDFLRDKTILIAGASGMLGSCLSEALVLWGGCHKVIVLSRDQGAARHRFESVWDSACFASYQHDITSPLPDLGPVDYIVHAASNADPVALANDPAGTLLTNVVGTKNLLDYGRQHGSRRSLFVSSGEVYGQPDAARSDFTEDWCGPLDLSSPRSCYPEGKRAGEVLCQSYASLYGVDIAIVRPCHLFGPTMTRWDSRAVSEFLQNAAAGKDIIMKSAGLLERSHCYVPDAVKGLLWILGQGEHGAAYNIADRRYQMTIRAFAEQAAKAGGCQVCYEQPSDLEARGYSKTARAVLDASRLEALGWRPDGWGRSAIEETITICREIHQTAGRED